MLQTNEYNKVKTTEEIVKLCTYFSSNASKFHCKCDKTLKAKRLRPCALFFSVAVGSSPTAFWKINIIFLLPHLQTGVNLKRLKCLHTCFLIILDFYPLQEQNHQWESLPDNTTIQPAWGILVYRHKLLYQNFNFLSGNFDEMVSFSPKEHALLEKHPSSL